MPNDRNDLSFFDRRTDDRSVPITRDDTKLSRAKFTSFDLFSRFLSFVIQVRGRSTLELSEKRGSLTFSSGNRKILKTNERETGTKLVVVGLTVKKKERREERTAGDILVSKRSTAEQKVDKSL